MSIVNDKTTPESSNHVVPTDWAQQLEYWYDRIYKIEVAALQFARERDEARKALDYIAYSGRSALHIEDYAKEFLARIVYE